MVGLLILALGSTGEDSGLGVGAGEGAVRRLGNF